jgi:N-acylneuraminate cytidylyltransferase
VTSEDDEILEHAKSNGADVVVRPMELATDHASGDHVIIDALEDKGISSGLTVFLQPTSPMRTTRLIDQCISEVTMFGWDSVFTAWAGHFIWRLHAPFWNPHVDQSGEDTRPYAVQIFKGERLPRQLIPATEIPYVENGCVYVSSTEMLIQERNRLCGKIGIVTMSREDSIDIDTEYDLWLAERRLEYLAADERVKSAQAVSA